jgi:hypothetical protein
MRRPGRPGRPDLIAALAIAAAGVITFLVQPRPHAPTVSVESVRYPVAVAGFFAVVYVLGSRWVLRLPWPRRERRPDINRFGPSMRAAIARAHAEALWLDHNYVGTEHLLLGLLGDPLTDVSQMLAARGIELEASRSRLEAKIGRGTEPVSGPIGLTPRSKRAIENAILFSPKGRNRGHAEAIHLLLGLLVVPDGMAVWLLIEGGCDVSEVARDATALV